MAFHHNYMLLKVLWFVLVTGMTTDRENLSLKALLKDN
jgi:hypothetical protein